MIRRSLALLLATARRQRSSVVWVEARGVMAMVVVAFLLFLLSCLNRQSSDYMAKPATIS